MSTYRDLLREINYANRYDRRPTRLVLTCSFAQKLRDDLAHTAFEDSAEMLRILEQVANGGDIPWYLKPVEPGDTGFLFGVPFEVVADQEPYVIVTEEMAGSPA